jgi:aminocarboxymuconate-semialdehyde decarboxylase
MTMQMGSDVGQWLSRRRVLQAGLAAATVGVVGGNSDALTQSQTQAAERSWMSAAGVRAVDIHAHYYPEAYLNVFNEDGKRFNAEYHMTDQGLYFKTPIGASGPLATNWMDLKQRIADMDQQGVAVQAMSLTSPMVYWGDAELDHKLATAWNDAANAAHQTYPTRLVSFCSLPMLYPDRALDELNRASRLPGIRGVYMGTNINYKDLDDPLFEPIWGRIEALDLPVFLHPQGRFGGGGDRTRDFHLANVLGNPFDTAIAACHLIFGGVLDRHPRLQIGLAHGGGAVPILIGRIDHAWQVRPETKHLPKAPSTYLQRFTYDTIVHSKPIMEFVIKEVGADRVMIGSDYCADMGYERPVQFLEQINLTSEERNMIVGGTAAKLLKL